MYISVSVNICDEFNNNNNNNTDICFSTFQQPCVKAIGKMFHPEHFICAQCGKQIANESFHLDSGKPYCAQDYKELFCVKCCLCKQVIGGGDRWLEALDKPWHADCFRCAVRFCLYFVLFCLLGFWRVSLRLFVCVFSCLFACLFVGLVLLCLTGFSSFHRITFVHIISVLLPPLSLQCRPLHMFRFLHSSLWPALLISTFYLSLLPSFYLLCIHCMISSFLMFLTDVSFHVSNRSSLISSYYVSIAAQPCSFTILQCLSPHIF